MVIIYLSLSALALLIGVLSYTSAAHKALKALAIVGVIALGLGLEGHYRASLGKPIEMFPEGEWLYVAHQVQGEDIFLWNWTEEDGNKLYVFSMTQEKAEQLEEMKEAQEWGVEMQGEFILNDSGMRTDQDPALIIDDWVGDYTGETKGG